GRVEGGGAAEAMAFPRKHDAVDLDATDAQRGRHGMCLPGRTPPVVWPRQEDDRAADGIRRVQRRASDVQIATLRVWADQALVVVRLELVRLAAQRLQVADAVVAGAGGEDVMERQGAEHGEPAGARSPHDQTVRVCPSLRDG